MTRLLTLPAVLLLTQAAAAQIPARLPVQFNRPDWMTVSPYRATMFDAGFDASQRFITDAFGRQAGYGPGFGYPTFGVGYYPYAGPAAYYAAPVNPPVVIERVPEVIFPEMQQAPAQPFDLAVYLSTPLATQQAVRTAVRVGMTTGVTVTLPAAAEVWLNGTKQKGTGKTFDLSVPDAHPGEPVKFDIRARWTANGETYDYDRSMTVEAGGRESLIVARGTPAKK